jgi:hypothetical protein
MPALMKLLGHRTTNMTLRYVEVTQKDLQREFYLARQNPRHRIPRSASAVVPDADAADGTAVENRLSAVSSGSAPALKNSTRIQKHKIGSDWPVK